MARRRASWKRELSGPNVSLRKNVINPNGYCRVEGLLWALVNIPVPLPPG